jgi:glycosyltransferase involved in cell wall biosynthesis
MATYAREHLVPHAVDLFLRQTHPAVELLVVDDGPSSVADLLPDDPRIRHLRLERRATIGAKRNLGCDAARGELLANWDDDDWYAPWRIAYQVQELVGTGAEVAGIAQLLYYDPGRRRAWRYAWPHAGRPWVHDAALLYTREFWRRNPFPDSNMALDCHLLWRAQPQPIHVHADTSFYVGIVHATNTSPKNVNSSLWRAAALDEVERLLGGDVAFYRGIAETAERSSRPMVRAVRS